MSNPSFQTQRLLLRPWQISDAPALARLTHDQGFTEFSTFSPLTNEESADFLANRLKLFRSGYGIWAVFHQNQIIGNVQLLLQTVDDSSEQLPEIGYRFQKSSWGQGLATEAAKQIRDYALQQLHLKWVYAFIDIHNVRSQSVASKLGLSPGPEARFKGSDIRVWSSALVPQERTFES